MKTNIKSFDAKINTNFYANGVPKEGSHYRCCSLVMLMHSVFKMDKKYYLQFSFKEWKYVVKENEMAELINDQLEVSSDHSDEEVSHEE